MFAESSRDIWWYVVWRRCERRDLRYGMSMFYSHDHRLTTHPQVYRSHSNVSLSYSFEISRTLEFQATYASLARRQAVISFSGSISERIADGM